ncbi:quaternary amine ABC transporter ATP-binding protein [Citricoccus muralis]|uniref:Betaine/proline/choline family ABC transporter ATP-binding protein n=1 Tax=Citricoccus muralis TaxID=169134 RepID=A0ABY8H7G9_9MICC|nr:betaine/proline/choline family ABC transporter ATP-binding protein [Citricoccus muralis]WFP17090.1 betaine/proline/choline family ABC transporter ATP-binding protein [Citricoccus muralis]
MTQPQAEGAASSTAEPVVRVRNVFKIFGKRPKEILRRIKAGEPRENLKDLGTAAVIDASFEVMPGEIFVVMGLSGSGKSTLIRTLNALQPATDGTVEVMGKDLGKLSKKQLRELRSAHMSMVFQHFALLPHRTVLDNAAYGLEIKGQGKAEREKTARDVLARVGLEGWDNNYPGELSGGMQQRVGLARALASGNDILLMDEAFSALDPLIRREMQHELVTLQKELGRTIIFITHDLNEAMFLGDRIAVMKDGRIAQIGTPEDILAHPADDYVASFTADVDRGRVLTAESVMIPAQELSESEQREYSSARIASVLPGATLQEIVPIAVEADGPVAVEGEQGGKKVRIGYVKVSQLLEAMAPHESITAAEHEPTLQTRPEPPESAPVSDVTIAEEGGQR